MGFWFLAFTVVLDAGHGGTNLGAIGVRPDVYEKRMTLAIAKQVEQRLVGSGVRVLLTRRDDRYLTIRERVRRANLWAPDLFVSLHFNASDDRTQRGAEVYVLEPDAAALDAHRAGRAARRLGGGEASAALAEHRHAEARRRAAEAAQLIQSRLVATLAEACGTVRAAVDRGVRQGPMDVLLGVRAPALLAELAYLDHPVEGREILRPRVQAELVEALAGAILTVAQQKGEP
jgi:N-acetylmuramoyl-L-alanine amidase